MSGDDIQAYLKSRMPWEDSDEDIREDADAFEEWRDALEQEIRTFRSADWHEVADKLCARVALLDRMITRMRRRDRQ